MSDLVEKVARSLCWKAGMNPDLTLGGDGQNFLWHEYVEAARTAIKAIDTHRRGIQQQAKPHE